MERTPKRAKRVPLQRITMESLRDGKHHILTKEQVDEMLRQENIRGTGQEVIYVQQPSRYFLLHEVFKIHNIKAYILGYDLEEGSNAHNEIINKIMAEQTREIRYIFVEDKLEDLAKLYKAFQEIEEITGVDGEMVMEIVVNQRDNDSTQAMGLLNDLVNNIGLEGYVMNFLPGESRKVKNFRQDNPFTYDEKSGLFSIDEKEIHKYIDPDDVELLIDQGYLEKKDPDEDLIELVIEAFDKVDIYPDDHWAEQEQVIRDLPNHLKEEILLTDGKVDDDINFEQYKEVRRVILKHLNII